MSRSRKKHPVSGITTSASEAVDKRIWHQRFRSRVRDLLRANPEAEVYPHINEVSNPWDMTKDGSFRFDPKKYPELMRK